MRASPATVRRRILPSRKQDSSSCAAQHRRRSLKKIPIEPEIRFLKLKTEQASTSRAGLLRAAVRPRKAKLLLSLLASLFALAACVNDLNPEGGWSGIAQEDNFLYIGSKDGRIVRVDSTTGLLDQSWVYPAEDDDDLGEVYGTPQVSNGTIYGSAFRCRGNNCDGEVYAVDIATGRSAWATGTVKYETRLVGSVGVGETTIAVGTSAIGDDENPPGFLIGLDPTSDAGRELAEQVSARERWRIPVDGAIWGGITVVDDIAYFGTLKGTLYAVDLSDNSRFTANPSDRIQWSFEAGGAIAGTPHVSGSSIYFGSLGDDVYALDLSNRRANPNSSVLDSRSEWKFDTGGWVWAEPLLQDGILYVASLPGKVFALNAQTGQPRWQNPAEVGDEIIARPTIFESNRGPALAVASGEGDISIVVLATGQVSGAFDSDGRGIKSSPVVRNDVIFAHTDNGQLRQYQPTSLSLLNCIEAKGEGKACG